MEYVAHSALTVHKDKSKSRPTTTISINAACDPINILVNDLRSLPLRKYMPCIHNLRLLDKQSGSVTKRISTSPVVQSVKTVQEAAQRPCSSGEPIYSRAPASAGSFAPCAKPESKAIRNSRRPLRCPSREPFILGQRLLEPRAGNRVGRNWHHMGELSERRQPSVPAAPAHSKMEVRLHPSLKLPTDLALR